MRFGSIKEVSSRAEHLQGEQREANNEVAAAEQLSDAIARRHAAISNQLRSVSGEQEGERVHLQSQLDQIETEWREAQARLAEAEARREAVYREIDAVTADAREYLRGVEGNLEAASGAGGSSPYGSASIKRLVSSFQLNKSLAEQVLSMFDQSGAGDGGAGLVGGSEVFQIPVGGDPNPESILHDFRWVRSPVSPLDKTRQQLHCFESGDVMFTRFNEPIETGKALNSWQGEAVPDFGGVCGMVSCQNIARLSGKNLSEADAIYLAQQECLGYYKEGEYYSNGGTYSHERQALLAHMGVESYLDGDLTPEHIADVVESGRGVIASVWTDEFWPGYTDHGGHAITVTSVDRDSSGTPLAFWVCDSGSGECARRVDAGMFRVANGDGGALMDVCLNVTTYPIR